MLFVCFIKLLKNNKGEPNDFLRKQDMCFQWKAVQSKDMLFCRGKENQLYFLDKEEYKDKGIFAG